MRPLTSLQGVRPSHSTEMTVELSTVTDTLLGATAAPTQRTEASDLLEVEDKMSIITYVYLSEE